MTAANVTTLPATRQGLVAKMAQRFSIDEKEFMNILKATAFKQRENSPPITDEQMMALLVVADEYGLNPFTKEIYAYPDKQNGIVPVISVDGWARIINESKCLDGIEFRYSENTGQHKGKTTHEWIECVITRTDRSKPIVVREYFDEVVRIVNFQTPWDSHPKRMHRHKTLIQCSRIAFGFAGIYDEDEAQRILEKDITSESTVVGGAGAPRPEPEPVYLDAATFYELERKYRKKIEDGSKTPEDFYAWVESKGSKMSDAQKQEVATWATAKTNVIDGEAKTVNDPFVDAMNTAEAKQGEMQ